ncbi:MAG: hypothetical protein ACOYOL_01210 [Chthoniobacterales bacterium]
MTLFASLSDFGFDQLFNFAEGLLWLAIAEAICLCTARSPKPRRLGYGAALSFALFGVSDFIEVRTGAWYSPWPLLVLKAACVLSLVGHFVAYQKRQRGSNPCDSGLDG